jgi:aryl-alcohol dehydrogenase-like predicted oxidoreductase
VKQGKVGRLAALAAKLEMPLHHLALNWCISNSRVSTVILGASKLSQLEDNLAALKSRDRVTEKVRAQIDAILQNAPAGPLRY